MRNFNDAVNRYTFPKRLAKIFAKSPLAFAAVCWEDKPTALGILVSAKYNMELELDEIIEHFFRDSDPVNHEITTIYEIISAMWRSKHNSMDEVVAACNSALAEYAYQDEAKPLLERMAYFVDNAKFETK